MKRYDELTEAELVALTDEQILDLVDLECAVEGVPMLPPHPGPKPVQEMIEPDTVIYSIGNLKFAKSEDAARIMELIATSELIDTDGYGSDERIAPSFKADDYNYPKLTNLKVLSQSKYQKVQGQIKAQERRLDDWTEIKRTYDKVAKVRESLVEAVNIHISKAHSAVYRRDCVNADFKRYIELANGDLVIAMNFLLKADPSIEADCPEVIDTLCPGYNDDKCGDIPEDAEQPNDGPESV